MSSPSHLIASKLQSPSSSATFEPHNSKCTLTYSSLAWTSHTTNNLSRSDRCNSPPLSALGDLLKPSRNISHNNLPRSVRSKLPPCVPRVPYSRDISHNKEPPQISLVQITSLWHLRGDQAHKPAKIPLHEANFSPDSQKFQFSYNSANLELDMPLS